MCYGSVGHAIVSRETEARLTALHATNRQMPREPRATFGLMGRLWALGSRMGRRKTDDVRSAQSFGAGPGTLSNSKGGR